MLIKKSLAQKGLLPFKRRKSGSRPHPGGPAKTFKQIRKPTDPSIGPKWWWVLGASETGASVRHQVAPIGTVLETHNLVNCVESNPMFWWPQNVDGRQKEPPRFS